MPNINNVIRCVKCKYIISSNKIIKEKREEVTIRRERVSHVKITKCLVTKCVICDKLLGVYDKVNKQFILFKHGIEYIKLIKRE